MGYTVCNSLCIFWLHFSKEMPSYSTFRVITTNFWGVRIFRKITVIPVSQPVLSAELIIYHTWKNSCQPSLSRALSARLTGNNNSTIYRYCSVESGNPQSAASCRSMGSIDSTGRNIGITPMIGRPSFLLWCFRRRKDHPGTNCCLTLSHIPTYSPSIHWCWRWQMFSFIQSGRSVGVYWKILYNHKIQTPDKTAVIILKFIHCGFTIK